MSSWETTRPQRAVAWRESVSGSSSRPPTTTTAIPVTTGEASASTTTMPETTSASLAVFTSEPSTPRKTLCTASVTRRMSAAELRRKWNAYGAPR